MKNEKQIRQMMETMYTAMNRKDISIQCKNIFGGVLAGLQWLYDEEPTASLLDEIQRRGAIPA